MGIHKSTITGYLNYRMHDADGAAGYETPFGGDHIIYLGHTSTQNTDLDFSMRDFYIDYTSGDLMNIDQAVMFKRNRF
jgi:hypothetical protein